jgi:hypothetical protein
VVSVISNRAGLPVLSFDHRGPRLCPPGGEDIANPESDKIATAQFAVGGHIEQREASRVASHLETDPDGPEVPRQERPFLADDAALVPGDAGGTKGGEKIVGHGFISRPPGPPFFGHADRQMIPRSTPGVGA